MSASHELLHALAHTLTAFADAGLSTGERVDALRMVEHAARNASIEVSDEPGGVTVNGEPLPEHAVGHEAVIDAMRAHGIRRLVVRRHAATRDVAQLAGVLGRAAPAGADPAALGVAAAAALDELRLWSVCLVPTRASNAPLPAAVESALGALAAASDGGEDAASERLVAALLEVTTQRPAERARVVAAALARALADEHAATLVAMRTRAAQLPLLVALADAIVSADDATRQDARGVFRHAGPAGIEGLLQMLTNAESIRQRRRCVDALIAVGGDGPGVPTLVEALKHDQWYVVRNAAQVLGELGDPGACTALTKTLAHADDRVRVSAAQALEQIGTAEARATLRAAVGDGVIAVRRVAARAFDETPETAADLGARLALVAAMEREHDDETLLDQVRALGRLGTPDAVQRLLRVATGQARAYSLAVRTAALEGLVRARGASALPTLRTLRQDRDAGVREAARRLADSIAA